MVSLRKGPTIERYAAIFGMDADEVVAWMNDYIERPGEFPALIAAGQVEMDEAARRSSVQAYVKRCVDESVTSRIKEASRGAVE